jgi:anti-sigma factor (TIGR02949 family)
MKMTGSLEVICEQTLGQLDSYLSNELDAKSVAEITQHLETCPACAAELQLRDHVRTRLKAVVRKSVAPPALDARIRESIRQNTVDRRNSTNWTHWGAIAATVFLVVGLSAGGWLWHSRSHSHPPLPGLADVAGQDVFIQKVAATVAVVMRVGLRDHIHCSIFRKYPKDPPAPEQMVRSLGPAWSGLLPLVKEKIPPGYRVIMAHRCSYEGRRFVHFTMLHEGDLLSLIIAVKEPGESLASLHPAAKAGGNPVYQVAADSFEVAGFETGRYMAFVISELNGGVNLKIATTLAPDVIRYLAAVPA